MPLFSQDALSWPIYFISPNTPFSFKSSNLPCLFQNTVFKTNSLKFLFSLSLFLLQIPKIPLFNLQKHSVLDKQPYFPSFTRKWCKRSFPPKCTPPLGSEFGPKFSWKLKPSLNCKFHYITCRSSQPEPN